MLRALVRVTSCRHGWHCLSEAGEAGIKARGQSGRSHSPCPCLHLQFVVVDRAHQPVVGGAASGLEKRNDEALQVPGSSLSTDQACVGCASVVLTSGCHLWHHQNDMNVCVVLLSAARSPGVDFKLDVWC